MITAGQKDCGQKMLLASTFLKNGQSFPPEVILRIAMKTITKHCMMATNTAN